MSKRILITGASGLIGAELTRILHSKGYLVAHLGRIKKEGRHPSYVWDIENQEIDLHAIENIDTIVHLAGANVGDKRWTTSRKKEILDSRIDSTALLFNTLKQEKHSVKTFISASAIGFYGFGSNSVFTEEGPAGKDFLAQITKRWEDEVDKFASLNIRVVKIRIGIVLSKNGGALKQMAQPIKFRLGSPLGSGKQYLSWIHINDICQVFAFAIENEKMSGTYNGVASWATNAEITHAIAGVLKKRCWLPNVPAFVLKLFLGEMANIVLNGSRVSSEKIQQAGFRLQYQILAGALNDIYKK